MRIIVLALAGVILSAPAARADMTCDSGAGRPSFGVALAGSTFDGRFGFQVVPTRLDQEVLALSGRGLQLDAGVGVTGRWGVRVERSSFTHGVERRTYDARVQRVQMTEFLDRMSTRELLVGVSRQHSRDGGPACVYSSVLAGTYRYVYNGAVSRAPGIAATIGVGAARGPGRPFAEMRIGIAHNDSRPPLNAYASISLGASVGLRYRW